MTSVFVFAYYSYKDPVFQSALLPYLKMVASPQFRFVVLTWEQNRYAMDTHEASEARLSLYAANIIWHRTRWHSGKFKIIKKAFDLLKGIIYSAYFIRRYKAIKIYSEGFPGAIIGHYLSVFTRVPHVIHTFEPHAQYMVESGVWTQKSWEYKVLKNLEISIANRSQYLVTGTHAYKELLAKNIDGSKILVVPSCVDTDHYKFSLSKRERIRNELCLRTDQIVIVYLGKMGGMYMHSEIFQFFNNCLSLSKDRFFFFLFTDENVSSVLEDLQRFNIPFDKVLVRYLTRNEVPDYLSAADIGFCGIRPIPSRRFSSPIKNGEYWACGLPILIPKGISDDYIQAVEHDLGFSFGDVSEIDLEILESLKCRDRRAIQEQAYHLRALNPYKEVFRKLFAP